MTIERTIPTPTAGDVITLDMTGPRRGIGFMLTESDGFFDSGFPGCEFRLRDDGGPLHDRAINIKITGRTVQWRSDGPAVRIKIEWVGDCEPSTFQGGWLRLGGIDQGRFYSQKPTDQLITAVGENARLMEAIGRDE